MSHISKRVITGRISCWIISTPFAFCGLGSRRALCLSLSLSLALSLCMPGALSGMLHAATIKFGSTQVLPYLPFACTPGLFCRYHNTNGIPFLGRCTTHFRTYFSGNWDVHGGYDLAFDPWWTQSLSPARRFPGKDCSQMAAHWLSPRACFTKHLQGQR